MCFVNYINYSMIIIKFSYLDDLPRVSSLVESGESGNFPQKMIIRIQGVGNHSDLPRHMRKFPPCG